MRNWIQYLILFAPLTVSAEAFHLKFEDIPELIADRNEHSKGARDLADSARKRTGFLVRSYLPSVEAKAGQETFETGPINKRTEPYGGVEARINVFRSGLDRLEDQIRREEHVSAKANATSAFRNELTKARKAYWELVSTKETIKLYELAIQDNQKHLAAANERIKAGIATQTDRIEFEMAKVELDQDLARAKLQAQNLERDLKALLNLSDNTEIKTVDIIGHSHDDSMLNASLNLDGHPTIQPLEAESKIADLHRKKSRSEWLPSVDLFGNRSLHTFREREYEDREDRWESVFGIQVSMKLFDGWNSPTEASAAALKAEGLKKQARQSADELKSYFEGAKAALKLNHDLIHDSESMIEKGRKYMTQSLNEYRRGVKSSIDILNASQRYFHLQKRYADLRKDYQLARADLMSIVGD